MATLAGLPQSTPAGRGKKKSEQAACEFGRLVSRKIPHQERCKNKASRSEYEPKNLCQKLNGKSANRTVIGNSVGKYAFETQKIGPSRSPIDVLLPSKWYIRSTSFGLMGHNA